MQLDMLSFAIRGFVMKKVTLLFPTPDMMTRFIEESHLIDVDIDALNKTIIGAFTEEQIVRACTNYGALLQSPETIG